jgi:hypothetical protein
MKKMVVRPFKPARSALERLLPRKHAELAGAGVQD